jgi:hypothetical protein
MYLYATLPLIFVHCLWVSQGQMDVDYVYATMQQETVTIERMLANSQAARQT